MSRSALLSGFIIPIINSQPKSCLSSVNTSIPIVSGNKRTWNGKNDSSRNPLVSYCNSEQYEAAKREHKTMESEETTHLLCGKSIYHAIGLNATKERRKDTESARDNFRYYAVDPACMNVRICIFWFLWAMLIAVLVISILSYCCFTTKMCHNSEEMTIANTTNA